MEDYKILIYILLGVAYLIFMNWRKAFKDPNEANLPEEDAPSPAKRIRPQRPPAPATSFEEMLRQLQPKAEQAQAKGEELVIIAKEKAQQVFTPEPKVTVIDYETAPAQRALSWEKRAEALEAARHSQQRRQSGFSAYDKPQPPKQRYQELLQDPASARDAFILSEIFQRKYK
ncbi:hypothetical protein [Pontibacter chitinilyticus]|uniref:hypothetical protein n=1 Tax=Pontibacter chitinilyticus TaxID=2674989 RepID=UPI00321B83EF